MALEGQNIYYTYPGSHEAVLRGFSASFEKASLTALTGANGCGKTTFSKILVGILKPGQGKVLLDGVDTGSFSLAETGRSIGYVMQNPNQQLFCATAGKEIGYGLKNLGFDEREIEKRTAYYLDYFELDAYRQSLPFHLSQGEKQRLVLAAVLAMEPRYLILDEPTAFLDIYRRRLLGGYLEKIVSDCGCGIILISHDRAFVNRYAIKEIKMEEDDEA